MSEDEMNAAVAGERPAEQEVCVVLQNVETGMRERLEALARWMGFVSEEEADAAPAGSGGVYFFWRHDVLLTVRFRKSLLRLAGGMSVYPARGWNPFTDANVDLAVLERAREVWEDSIDWNRFVVAYLRRANRVPGAISFPPVYATASTVLEAHAIGDYARAVLATISPEQSTTDTE